MSSDSKKFQKSLKIYTENQEILKNLSNIANKKPFSRKNDNNNV